MSVLDSILAKLEVAPSRLEYAKLGRALGVDMSPDRIEFEMRRCSPGFIAKVRTDLAAKVTEDKALNFGDLDLLLRSFRILQGPF